MAKHKGTVIVIVGDTSDHLRTEVLSFIRKAEYKSVTMELNDLIWEYTLLLKTAKLIFVLDDGADGENCLEELYVISEYTRKCFGILESADEKIFKGLPRLVLRAIPRELANLR